MSFSVKVTKPFERKAKRLSKKHRSLKSDLQNLISSLSENPEQGTSLGKNCYKVRLTVSSKSKGKSGGARVFTLVRLINKTVFLLDIYDKSEKETITDKELRALIDAMIK